MEKLVIPPYSSMGGNDTKWTQGENSRFLLAAHGATLIYLGTLVRISDKLHRNPFVVALKVAQSLSYPNILKYLRNEYTNLSSDHKTLIHQKHLSLSADGLIRCGTRLQHSELSVTSVNPVLLIERVICGRLS